MDFLYNVFLFLHFIGLASLLGGFLVQMSSAEKGVNPAMLHGAITQLVTGVLMVGMAESGAVELDPPLNMTKVGIKLLVVLVITVLAIIGRRRQGPQTGLWGAIGALALVNVALAVFWQ